MAEQIAIEEYQAISKQNKTESMREQTNQTTQDAAHDNPSDPHEEQKKTQASLADAVKSRSNIDRWNLSLIKFLKIAVKYMIHAEIVSRGSCETESLLDNPILCTSRQYLYTPCEPLFEWPSLSE